MIIIALIIIIAVREHGSAIFELGERNPPPPLELLDRRVIYFRRGCK